MAASGTGAEGGKAAPFFKRTSAKVGGSALRGRNQPSSATVKSKGSLPSGVEPRLVEGRLQKGGGSEQVTPRASSAGSSLKLQEICYIKGNGGGKKLVAKYFTSGAGGSSSTSKQCCDNLVVAWSASGGGPPQVFTEKPSLAAVLGAGIAGPSAATEGSAPSSSASTRGKYAGYRVAKFGGGAAAGGFKQHHKRLKINKPLTGGSSSAAKSKSDKFKKSRKKLRAKLI